MIRRGILEFLSDDEPLVVSMDDSLLRKTGARIPGVAYLRDPLSPPFRVNLVRGQRILQLSAALPQQPGSAPARMIPIAFLPAPAAKKPHKNAPPEAWAEYRRLQRQNRLSQRGAQQIQQLRAELNQDEPRRPLWMMVDGSFTNGTVLKNLPERTTLVGRIRGDAKLYHLPGVEAARGRGRKPEYGERAPTPVEARQDDSLPWEKVSVFAAGRLHEFKVKTLAPLLWRSAGAQLKLRLLVIAPLAYRPNRRSRLLYRQPAYLLCTDTKAPLSSVLQAYVWRWDIEVNFREEKQLIGVGEAQVRNRHSVEKAPALAVAGYGLLLLAAARAFGRDGFPESLPPPKWRNGKNGKKKIRPSSADLISHLRSELWGQALLGDNFSGFLNPAGGKLKPEKFLPNLASAVLYVN